jgi:hypothetical protein
VVSGLFYVCGRRPVKLLLPSPFSGMSSASIVFLELDQIFTDPELIDNEGQIPLAVHGIAPIQTQTLTRPKNPS